MVKCKECGNKFDLLPNKPGFANVCPTCTENTTHSNRKATEQEELRKSLLKSKLLNKKSANKKQKGEMTFHQSLEALGLELVPETNEIRRIPKKKRVAK
jgi:hypothetical protein